MQNRHWRGHFKGPRQGHNIYHLIKTLKIVPSFNKLELETNSCSRQSIDQSNWRLLSSNLFLRYFILIIVRYAVLSRAFLFFTNLRCRSLIMFGMIIRLLFVSRSVFIGLVFTMVVFSFITLSFFVPMFPSSFIVPWLVTRFLIVLFAIFLLISSSFRCYVFARFWWLLFALYSSSLKRTVLLDFEPKVKFRTTCFILLLRDF